MPGGALPCFVLYTRYFIYSYSLIRHPRKESTIIPSLQPENWELRQVHPWSRLCLLALRKAGAP